MRRIQREVSMGFTKETFPAGTHMCLIYSDDLERRKLISKFLECGLKAGEMIAYFVDTMTSEDAENWLVSMNVDIPHGSKAGQLSIKAAESTYCPNGRFVPEDMLDTLRCFYRQTIKEGYPGARVSGEMTWALKGIPGSERLMEYEARVNDVLVTHPVTAICQYDANRFDGATIFDVLRVHPMMIVSWRDGTVFTFFLWKHPINFTDFYKLESTISMNLLHTSRS
ncbi:MAG TPA: hypothetical protein ENI15_07900 [Spirochaetes bacterium]|nr:hypothetical protein [Spirochaetota bacterium]